MKYFHWTMMILFGFLMLGCAKGGTYSLSVRYQPVKAFHSLQQEIGPTLGLAPFRDERQETLYVGRYTPFLGVSTYFKSKPFPLENALQDSLSQVLSRNGVKIVPIPDWDGRPDSLRTVDADSILTIEIKRFWLEGNGTLFRSDLRTSIRLIIHLGVKKEGKVFTRNVEVEKEMTFPRLTPARMEQVINPILTDIFDSFFSNPY